MYNVQYTMTQYYVNCIMYNVHRTLYSAQCIVYSILTLYTLRQKVKWLATELVKSGYLDRGETTS